MSDKTTFVSFLLDETGSMQSIKDDTVGGFNEYLSTLRESGEDIVFSFVSFNSTETRRRCIAEPIASVKPLEPADYEPRHSTPLIDASVKIIKATEEAVAHRGDDPKVVVVIQTDGQENVSVEHTNADLAALIKEKDAAGWKFVFLGAGLDAFAAAREAGLHIPAEQIASYARGRSREAFRATADNLSAFAQSGETKSLSYSADQRQSVGDEYADQYLEESASGGNEAPKKRRWWPFGARSTADDYDLSDR